MKHGKVAFLSADAQKNKTGVFLCIMPLDLFLLRFFFFFCFKGIVDADFRRGLIAAESLHLDMASVI